MERAKAGEIIGIAYAAMLAQRAFVVDSAGTAYDSPTFARGMCLALIDKLGTRV